jgi:hypothetical protein
MISPYHWKALIMDTEPKLHSLINACYEFESYSALMANLNLNELKSGAPLSDMQIMVHRIYAEYFKIFDGEKEVIVEKLDKDIHATISHWFDDKGQWRNLTQELVLNFERKQLQIFMPLFLTPMRSFVQSRIYDSLNESIKQRRGLWGDLLKNMDLSAIKDEPAVQHDWDIIIRKVPSFMVDLLYNCRRYDQYLDFLRSIAPCNNEEHKNKYLGICTSIVSELIHLGVAVSQSDGGEIYFENFNLIDMPYLVNFIYKRVYKISTTMATDITNDFMTDTKKKAGIFPALEKKSAGGFPLTSKKTEKIGEELID